MSATKASFLIIIAFLLIKPTQAYITRTACRNSANFTEVRTDMFVKDEGNIIRHKHLNRSRCALLCIATPSCYFINHKRDNTLCRLVTSLDVRMVEKDGMDVVQTDYRLWHLRGPLCRYLDVKLNPYEFCFDTCEPPGYKIKKRQNIVSGLNAIITDPDKFKKTKQLTNDDGITMVFLYNTKGPVDVSFTLDKVFPICRMTLTRKGNVNPMTYDITISKTVDDDGEYCVKNYNQLERFHILTCDRCPIFGKEIRIRVHKYEEGKNAKEPKFRQIKVYEF